MKSTVKHAILFLSSFLFVFSSACFVPSQRVASLAETRNVIFGYPIGFLVQDFSSTSDAAALFPRYFIFSFDKKMLFSFTHLLPLQTCVFLLLSWICLEMIILCGEWIKRVVFRK